jgi:hypothetical protein
VEWTELNETVCNFSIVYRRTSPTSNTKKNKCCRGSSMLLARVDCNVCAVRPHVHAA